MGRPKLYNTPGIKGLRQTLDPKSRKTGIPLYYIDLRVGPKKKRIIRPVGEDLSEAITSLKMALGESARLYEQSRPVGPLRLSEAQEFDLDSRLEPLKPATLSKYRYADNVALRTLGDLWLHEITPSTVRGWLRERSETVGPCTFNRDLKRLRSVFRWAIEEGRARSNPCDGIKERKEPRTRVRYLTLDEQARLKEVCSPHLWLMARFAMLTGLRISEQLGLEWSQIVDGQVRLRAGETKSGLARVIPFGAPVQDILDQLPRDNALVFPSPTGILWDRNNFGEDFWRPARDAAGIVGFRWHDLRATFASRLVMAGTSLYTVAELLGHQSIKTTQIYAHLSPEHLREAVAVLQ